MFRKVQKDLNKDGYMLNCSSNSNSLQNQISTSLFRISGLFVRIRPKSSSECDSAMSPASHLDSRQFSGLGKSFWSQWSCLDGFENQKRSWCTEGIGLGIVGSLSDVKMELSEISVEKSKNILFGSQLRFGVAQCRGCESHLWDKTSSCVTSPKSLPNYIFPAQRGVETDIWHPRQSHFAQEPNAPSYQTENPEKCSPESIVDGSDISLGSTKSGFFCSGSEISMMISSSDSGCFRGTTVDELLTGSNTSLNSTISGFSTKHVDLSEDCTCVISRGAHPKTKHIYGDRVLEESRVFEIVASNCPNELSREFASSGYMSSLADNFLSVCHFCKKKLEGEDIYMYRGEKAFCSSDCRLQEIMVDEGIENASMSSPASSTSDNVEKKSPPPPGNRNIIQSSLHIN